MSQPRRLIINADDFGVTHGVNRVIVEAYEQGIVTSASLLPNAEASEDAAKAAARTGLPVGLHFNLTLGGPVARPDEVPSLVDREGRFLSRGALLLRWLRGHLRADEVRCELRRQLERLERLGVTVRHIDSHQHVHAIPGVLPAVIAEARARRLPLRHPSERLIIRARAVLAPDRLLRKLALGLLCRSNGRHVRRSGVPTPARLVSIFSFVPPPQSLALAHYRVLLAGLGPGISELMVHVGDVDGRYRSLQPEIAEVCAQETAIVLGPDFAKLLAELEIEPVPYDAVAGTAGGVDGGGRGGVAC